MYCITCFLTLSDWQDVVSNLVQTNTNLPWSRSSCLAELPFWRIKDGKGIPVWKARAQRFANVARSLCCFTTYSFTSGIVQEARRLTNRLTKPRPMMCDKHAMSCWNKTTSSWSARVPNHRKFICQLHRIAQSWMKKHAANCNWHFHPSNSDYILRCLRATGNTVVIVANISAILEKFINYTQSESFDFSTGLHTFKTNWFPLKIL